MESVCKHYRENDGKYIAAFSVGALIAKDAYSCAIYVAKNERNKNIPEDKTIVVMPEGSFANYITNRKSDNKYHNLVPMYYIDTFGEEKVIQHFTEQPADYFAIIPLSTMEYGSPHFCVYAKNFCDMIEKNYTLEKDEERVKIYKRK